MMHRLLHRSLDILRLRQKDIFDLRGVSDERSEAGGHIQGDPNTPKSSDKRMRPRSERRL